MGFRIVALVQNIINYFERLWIDCVTGMGMRDGCWSFRKNDFDYPPYMTATSNGNIFRVIGPLRGEVTVHRWIIPHKGQWRGALMFSFNCAWLKGWVNNRETGDLGCHRAHYDVIVMRMYFQTKFKATCLGLLHCGYFCVFCSFRKGSVIKFDYTEEKYVLYKT